MNAQIAQAQALLAKEHPNPDKAIKTLQPLLNSPKKHWVLYHLMGVASLQKGSYDKAKSYFIRALKQGTNEPESYHHLSVALYHLGKYEEAIFYAKEAINRKKDYLEGWINLGASYRAMADLDNAMQAYGKANQIDPSNAGVAYRIGSIYFDQGDLKQARNLYQIVLQVNPKYIEAYLGLALIHLKVQEFQQAVEIVNKALEIDPGNRYARIQLAVVYKEMGLYSKAIALNEKLLYERPGDGHLRVNYALCLVETGQFNKAEKNYLRALRDSPSSHEALSNYLMGIHYNPARTKDEIFNAHLLWDKHFAPKVRKVRPVPKNLDPNKQIRVGLISGGFRKHPVGWMITRAIEHLPKDQFEIYTYTTHSLFDSLSQRIRKASDKWISILGYNDEVVANILKEDEIDILVELSGHSAFNRLKTVALEPVPITLKWVGGLFNTTGLQSMDYLLTDHVESPEGEEKYYTEKLVRMPHDYVCYEPPEYDIKVDDLPAMHNGFITFGCFNNPSKLNKILIQQWAEILKNLPTSKLFFKSKQYDTNSYVDFVKANFEEFGITEERLIFEGYSMHQDLLCAYNKVDISLDPWPYSGGLTTCEALWMGVPVISNTGPTFAGRHSATHLSNAGFSHWVTDNWNEYRKIVLDLASDIPALADLRQTLRPALLNSPLCDGPRFGAHLADALRQMWSQRVKGYTNMVPEGEWQDHIEVQPISEKGLREYKNKHKYFGGEPLVCSQVQLPTHGNLQLSVPEGHEQLTHFVLKEQKQWLDEDPVFLLNMLAEGSTVIDVGAGFGCYAVPLAQKMGIHGCVFAFEPHPATAAHLRESKRINYLPQLEIIETAVSDTTGSQPFVRLGTSESSHLTTNDVPFKVPTTTLDDFWMQYGNPPVHLIKVDVNGTEGAVLKGAAALIEAQLPVILVAENNQEQEQDHARQILQEAGYQFFELIPELGILSEYSDEANAFRKNYFALQAHHLDELTQAGLIFKDGDFDIQAEAGAGLASIKNFPWASSFGGLWNMESGSEAVVMYFKALDQIAMAQETKSGVEKAQRLLKAAGSLLDLYNANPTNTPVSFTLIRVLNILAKREDAVRLSRQTMERLLSSVGNEDLSLPFFLPVQIQDDSALYSNPQNWLKIKAAEAWLLLKDRTSYSFTAKDVKLLHRLNGSPEVTDHLKFLAETFFKKGEIKAPADPEPKKAGKFIHICQNHVYAQSLSDMLANANQQSEQQHLLYLEKHESIKTSNVNIENSEHVVKFDNFEELEQITKACLADDIDAVFVHGIFFEWQQKLIKNIGHQKHIAWIIWGGDLYNPIKSRQPNRFQAALVDSILTTAAGDVSLFNQTYGHRPNYAFAYPIAGLYSSDLEIPQKQDPPTIYIGNSGDEENDHIGILEVLATKPDVLDYHLILPVAYNFNDEYEVRLLQAIERLGLSEITSLQKEFLLPTNYVQNIGQAKMVITAHNRQQAVGNLMASLYFGNPTFLKEEIMLNGKRLQNPGWQFFSSNGFKVNRFEDLESIVHLRDIQPASDEQRIINQQIINEKFGLHNRAKKLIEASNQILKKVRVQE